MIENVRATLAQMTNTRIILKKAQICYKVFIKRPKFFNITFVINKNH